jgi:hypothetical protein
MAHVVQCRPSKYEALSSKPSTANKTKEQWAGKETEACESDYSGDHEGFFYISISIY